MPQAQSSFPPFSLHAAHALLPARCSAAQLRKLKFLKTQRELAGVVSKKFAQYMRWRGHNASIEVGARGGGPFWFLSVHGPVRLGAGLGGSTGRQGSGVLAGL